jgi:flavin-dependent dehydrogenase
MNQQDLMKIGMAVGICFAAYKFGQHPAIKAGAIAVAAVVVAKRVPVLSTALA